MKELELNSNPVSILVLKCLIFTGTGKRISHSFAFNPYSPPCLETQLNILFSKIKKESVKSTYVCLNLGKPVCLTAGVGKGPSGFVSGPVPIGRTWNPRMGPAQGSRPHSGLLVGPQDSSAPRHGLASETLSSASSLGVCNTEITIKPLRDSG